MGKSGTLPELIKKTIALPKPAKTSKRKAVEQKNYLEFAKRLREECGACQNREALQPLSQAFDEAPVPVVDCCEVQPEEISSIVVYCTSHEATDAEVYCNLWHYLERELLTSKAAQRLRCLSLIQLLAAALPAFVNVLAQHLQSVARSALLWNSVSGEQRSKDKAKGTPAELRLIEDSVKAKIELWNGLYGKQNGKFRLMYRYFIDELQLEMPNVEQRALAEENRNSYEQQLTMRNTLREVDSLLRTKLIDEELSSARATLDSLDQCFEILFPSVELSHDETTMSEAAEPLDDDEPEEDIDWESMQWESADANSATEARDWNGEPSTHALPFTIEFDLETSAQSLESDDNADVIAAIRDQVTILARRSVPKLSAWKSQCELAAEILSTWIVSSNANTTDAQTSAAAAHGVSIVSAHKQLSRIRRILSQLNYVLLRASRELSGRVKELLEK